MFYSFFFFVFSPKSSLMNVFLRLSISVLCLMCKFRAALNFNINLMSFEETQILALCAVNTHSHAPLEKI